MRIASSSLVQGHRGAAGEVRGIESGKGDERDQVLRQVGLVDRDRLRPGTKPWMAQAPAKTDPPARPHFPGRSGCGWLERIAQESEQPGAPAARRAEDPGEPRLELRDVAHDLQFIAELDEF